ncbi:MAG: hypothetical protein WC848_02475 [Parcubacteria group bacterium]|jgi:hypothetical protein
MKTKDNPENKYIEQILNLADRVDFMDEIHLFRKKLGIPKNGFKTQKNERGFLVKNNLQSHIDPKSKSEIERLKKLHKNNPDLLAMILSWNNLYSNDFSEKLLDKFQIPRRASTHLHSFILFGKNKPLYELADSLATGYGCQVNTAFFWPGFEYDIEGFLYNKKDLSALIFVYPEATKADLKKMIDDNWTDIKRSQLETARKNNLPLPAIHSKIFRDKQDKIIELHKKGLTSYRVADELGLSQEGSFAYVRKVISRKKEVSQPRAMTKDEVLSAMKKLDRPND